MNFIQRLPGPHLILDSSFNPPTIAHRALLQALTPPGYSKLLLLSTANADKKPTPAAFPQRTEMMRLLSQSLQSSPSPPSSSSSFGAAIALIDRATFADKARCAPELKGATWIMGWDTLVRFFAPRYYPNDSMGPVLRTFFLEDQAKVVFAPRPTNPTQKNGEQEKEKTALLEFISSFLKEHGIPSSCVKEVAIDAELAEISSSAVRKARKESEEWRRMVTPEIADYIEHEGLYLD